MGFRAWGFRLLGFGGLGFRVCLLGLRAQIPRSLSPPWLPARHATGSRCKIVRTACKRAPRLPRLFRSIGSPANIKTPLRSLTSGACRETAQLRFTTITSLIRNSPSHVARLQIYLVLVGRVAYMWLRCQTTGLAEQDDTRPAGPNYHSNCGYA